MAADPPQLQISLGKPDHLCDCNDVVRFRREDLAEPDPQDRDISFQRTVRVSEDNSINNLPPSLGTFPLFETKHHAATLPKGAVAKGGYFFPTYQREAMWINLTSNARFAIKVFVGGVNAVSAQPAIETETTLLKRMETLQQSNSMQDYVVTPQQLWLDGIAQGDGTVRQFVAMPLGSGYSVEAQITGEDHIGGFQIEVIPSKWRSRYRAGNSKAGPHRLNIKVKTLTGKLLALQVHVECTVDRLKGMVEDMEGIPPCNQRFIYNGKQLEDGRLLTDYHIKEGTTVHFVLRLRGGGGDLPMGIAAGGLIKQTIGKDTHDPSGWQPESGTILKFTILNSEAFKQVTGQDPPETPITVKTYAMHGYPYFSLLVEKPSGIFGNFSVVHSVAAKDANGEVTEEKSKVLAEITKGLNMPLILLGANGQRAPFRPVSRMVQEIEEMARAVLARK